MDNIDIAELRRTAKLPLTHQLLDEIERLRADNIRLIDERTENGQLCYERGVHIEAQDSEIERLRTHHNIVQYDKLLAEYEAAKAEIERLRAEVAETEQLYEELRANCKARIEELEAALRKARGRLIAITRGSIKFGHDPIIGVIDEALERK